MSARHHFPVSAGRASNSRAHDDPTWPSLHPIRTQPPSVEVTLPVDKVFRRIETDSYILTLKVSGEMTIHQTGTVPVADFDPSSGTMSLNLRRQYNWEIGQLTTGVTAKVTKDSAGNWYAKLEGGYSAFLKVPGGQMSYQFPNTFTFTSNEKDVKGHSLTGLWQFEGNYEYEVILTLKPHEHSKVRNPGPKPSPVPTPIQKSEPPDDPPDEIDIDMNALMDEVYTMLQNAEFKEVVVEVGTGVSLLAVVVFVLIIH